VPFGGAQCAPPDYWFEPPGDSIAAAKLSSLPACGLSLRAGHLQLIPASLRLLVGGGGQRDELRVFSL